MIPATRKINCVCRGIDAYFTTDQRQTAGEGEDNVVDPLLRMTPDPPTAFPPLFTVKTSPSHGPCQISEIINFYAPDGAKATREPLSRCRNLKCQAARSDECHFSALN